MKKWLLILLIAMIVPFMAACGDDDDDDDSNGSSSSSQSMTEAEFMNEFAKSMCSKMFNCSNIPEITLFRQIMSINDENQCVATIGSFIAEEDGSPEDTSMDTEDDCPNPNISKANQCLDCFKNLSCDNFAKIFSMGEDGMDPFDICPTCNEICPETSRKGSPGEPADQYAKAVKAYFEMIKNQ